MEYAVSVSCKDLKDTDVFSKSDPMLILLRNVPNTKKYVELGRTEMIKDCLNPEFARQFRLAPPDADVRLRVAVVDIDDFEHADKLSEQEFIGRAEFNLSDLLAQRTFTVTLGGNSGFVTFKSVQYQPELDGRVQLKLENVNFDLHGEAGFLEIHRADESVTRSEATEDTEFTLAHRSEQALGARFAPIAVSLFTLALGDLQRLLRISCWRCGSRGNHKLLASCFTSLHEMQHVFDSESSPMLTFTDKHGGVSCFKLTEFSVKQ